MCEKSNKELINQYRFYLTKEEDKSKDTIETYCCIINLFSRFISKSFLEVTKEDLINFIKQDNLAPKTQLKYKFSLISFYKFLKIEKLIEQIPIDYDRWPKIKQIKKEKEFLNDTQIRTIINYLNNEIQKNKNNLNEILDIQRRSKCSYKYKSNQKFKNHTDNLGNIELKKYKQSYQDKIIFLVLYSTGFRRSELVKIKLTDFDFEKNHIKTLGKGKKEREIPYFCGLTIAIKEYLEIIEHTSEYLFPSLLKGDNTHISVEYVNKLFKIISKETGIYVYPHEMRRTFLTTLYLDGLDSKDVSGMAGHSDTSTTNLYIPKVKPVEYLGESFKKHEKAFVDFNNLNNDKEESKE